MEKLWTTAEAARYLGITEVDVEQLVREGKLTSVRLGGQFLRFNPSQVENIKASLRFRPNVKSKNKAVGAVFPAMQLREFFYFNDFYVVSAALLMVLVVYLIAAS